MRVEFFLAYRPQCGLDITQIRWVDPMWTQYVSTELHEVLINWSTILNTNIDLANCIWRILGTDISNFKFKLYVVSNVAWNHKKDLK